MPITLNKNPLSEALLVWQQQGNDDGFLYWCIMKRCCTCKEVKPYSDFYKNKTCRDGYSYDCKSCKKKYFVANKDAVTRKRKEWVEKNRDHLRDYTARRRAKIRGNGGGFSAEEWLTLVKDTGNKCLCCGVSGDIEKLSIDHIVPVIHGGHSNIWNIQPLCKGCNSRKSAKTIDYRPDDIKKAYPPKVLLQSVIQSDKIVLLEQRIMEQIAKGEIASMLECLKFPPARAYDKTCITRTHLEWFYVAKAIAKTTGTDFSDLARRALQTYLSTAYKSLSSEQKARAERLFRSQMKNQMLEELMVAEEGNKEKA